MKSAQPSAKSEAALVSKISVEQRKQFGRVVAKVLLQLCSASTRDLAPHFSNSEVTVQPC